MTQLAAVVEASARVAQTGSRLAKRDAIAACLRAAAPDEVEIAVAFLSGETRQGKLGVGYATLSAAARRRGDAAVAHAGRGRCGARANRPRPPAKARQPQRTALLHALFARATRAEQDFLIRLLVGELRQGALEGVMVEAIAAAATLPVERRAARRDVRRQPRRSRPRRARPKAAPGSQGSRSRCIGRCSRCSRNRPRTSPTRCDASAPPRSNGSSTARACRCTRRATRCACTRARSTT